MAEAKFGSAGVSTREIDLSGPLSAEPVGVPAGIIGTAIKGPAFVPMTVGILKDFYAKFGETDGKKFGPLAVSEWLRNAQAVTYLRVLGVGDGKRRNTGGANPGSVTSAGFVVGEKQPNSTGAVAENPYANSGGPTGRTFFLGALMSESNGSTYLSDAATQSGNVAAPIIRGVLMAASGVLPRLSSSFSGTNTQPASSAVAANDSANGGVYGSVKLMDTTAKQEFILLLNGHKGTDSKYPNVITASFDPTAINYFANVLNKDPLKVQEAGYVLYKFWDIHPAQAVVSGVGVIQSTGVIHNATNVYENIAFLATGALGYNVGSSTIPNYENFQTRFEHAKTPWVVSQKFGGIPVNLFRLHSLDAGVYAHNKIKFSIENITPSNDLTDQYGTFDVLIRDFLDSDSEPRVLERFRGVNLNPRSDRYIAKVIGDLNVYFDFDRDVSGQKLVVDGNYPNKSNYVRVQVADDVDSAEVEPTALPMGFRGAPHLVTSGSAPLAAPSSSYFSSATTLKKAVQPPVPFRLNVTNGSGATAAVNSALYWGVQFEQVTSTSTPNASLAVNKAVENFAKYLPDFQTSNTNIVAYDNNGVADTDANGIMDADRFQYNLFTLENIQVVTASGNVANANEWDQATYVRRGNIVASEANKTRALQTSDLTTTNRRYAKFSFFMFGGFDGANIFDEDAATFTNTAVTEEMNNATRGVQNGPTVKTFMKAVDIMKNTSDVDIQLLAIPGIRHSIITDTAILSTEERFDALFVMDIEEYDNLNVLLTGSAQLPSVANTITNFRNRALDSNFAAAYYPDVIMTDPTTLTNVVVPPSVAVLGALALNDAVGHPWFAPAGFTRGALPTVQEAKVKLSKGNLDSLYDVSVNPIVAFPGAAPATAGAGGPVVWGQKTLQVAQSALDRVNVRRLMIDLRRQVRDIANRIIFEPNRETTLQKFASEVTPRLAKIQAQGGLERFKVAIDTSTTTQADIENNTIRGKIVVQPTKAIEFVSLDFVVTSPGKV